MKKWWMTFTFLAVVFTVLAFYYVYLNLIWSEQESMNRAQVARILTLTFYDYEEYEEHEEHIKNMVCDEYPEDLLTEQWYGKYGMVALDEGWIKPGENGLFEPGEAFDYADLKHVMEHFYITEDMLSFKIQYRQDDGKVLKKHWNEVYNLILINQNRVQKKQYTIQNTAKNNNELNQWQVNTDEGLKIAEGLWMDPYLDRFVETYEVDEHILYVSKIIRENEKKEATQVDETEKIRVILNEKDGDYEHDSIVLTSDQTYYVTSGQQVWKYSEGYSVEFHKDDLLFDKGDVRIVTEDDHGCIEIQTLKRACGKPSYSGAIELCKGESGICIINEIEMEDYVAGVVSSEMPSSYGIEALKAQAVCARTYGKKALNQSFQHYPANVDDTTATQVYNNILATSESTLAANDTKGLVLKQGNNLSDTYFFSTSCGHTSAAQDVWYDGSQDQGNEAVTVFLSNDRVNLDLIYEEDFRSFMNLENEIDYFEKDLPWFRWQVFVSDEIIEAQVLKLMGKDLGNLIHVSIIERAKSGVIKSIQIQGEKGACTVYGEYRIRQIFSPTESEIIQNDGNSIFGMSLLPSGYFYMDALIEEDICEGYLIHGGGYGHGCGMSQNGAMAMAEQGVDYQEILKYFFAESELAY